MGSATEDVGLVIECIEREVPPTSWPKRIGGWPGQLEAAVLDSVFSIRARYGTETTGVRAVVGRWSMYRDAELDDLQVLADFATRPDDLVTILGNHQKLSGGLTTAAGAASAAAGLLAADVRHAADVTTGDRERDAWCSIKGLSDVTWTYVLMLLGVPGVKADVMIRRFVRSATGRPTSAGEAGRLVLAAAARLYVDVSDLDHAIWSWRRRQRP